jgi:hypothetical protein
VIAGSLGDLGALPRYRTKYFWRLLDGIAELPISVNGEQIRPASAD